MTIKKFGSKGKIERVGKTDRVRLSDGQAVEATSLQASGEQKYVGTWSPGKNHPQQAPDKNGPYAGIPRYLPIPENQIER